MESNPRMSNSKQIATADDGDEAGEAGSCVAGHDDELRARFERVRALNSAWAVLAPFEVSAEARHVVETGREVNAELAQLESQPLEGRDRAALPKLDKLLDDIESEIRAVAFELPVAKLRWTLPARLSSERRGVLDLLDLMLVAELEGHDGSAGRISAIDYLITLLSTAGADGYRSILQDPVGLTPRLLALCERADADDDPRLAEIEAEFDAAAAGEDDARAETQLRTSLRQRKRELGASFFAPRVLRAIVAYNAALSRGIDRGLWDARDWGSLADAAEQSGADTSVLETEVLPRLGEALRRRAQGGAPRAEALDRIAWCLDLSSLDEAARGAVRARAVGRPGDLEGTAILVALLCRSETALKRQYPAIGISPERVSSEWLLELDAALRLAVNERIARNAYREASALSELRTTFLDPLMTGMQREPQRPEPPRFDPMQREAQDLATEALKRETTRIEDEKKSRSWPPARIARFGAACASVGLLALALAQVFLGGDLDRLNGTELRRVSPYLTQGGRNAEGRGLAFVGTINDDWSQLPANQQEQAAMRLVKALRARGVRNVMIYDAERRLRIQALGERSAHVLPTPDP